METLDRADALWFLTGYEMDRESAGRILEEMRRHGIDWTSATLRSWRDYLTA